MKPSLSLTSRIVAVICLLSLLGCTSMRPIDQNQVDLSNKLKPGDLVVIYEKTGRIVEMKLTSIEADRLLGHPTKGMATSPVVVSIRDIEKIEVEKVDGVKTTFAVVGGTIVVVPLLVVAMFIGVMSAE